MGPRSRQGSAVGPWKFKAVAIAHRNLPQRIVLYLAEMEAAGHEPSWREGDRLLEAIKLLSARDFANGERGVMWAEVATRHKDGSERHPTLTTSRLVRKPGLGWTGLEDANGGQRRGFKTQLQGVTMHRPNEPGYSRAGLFVLDDWR